MRWPPGSERTGHRKKYLCSKPKKSSNRRYSGQVATILKVPVDAIKNFNEEAAINIISNTVNNNDHATGNALFSYYPTINPIEKWMEALEENKKLYLALMKEKDEKINLLSKMLHDKTK